MNPRTRRAALYAIGAIAILASANALAHSYAGLYDWAVHHRLSGWQAKSWPAEIDVFLAVGELALYVAYLDGWPARQRIWPWTTALTGLAVSIAGNIGHIQAVPGHPVILADRLTAATSPIAAFAGLSVGLLVLKMTRQRAHIAAPEPRLGHGFGPRPAADARPTRPTEHSLAPAQQRTCTGRRGGPVPRGRGPRPGTAARRQHHLPGRGRAWRAAQPADAGPAAAQPWPPVPQRAPAPDRRQHRAQRQQGRVSGAPGIGRPRRGTSRVGKVSDVLRAASRGARLRQAATCRRSWTRASTRSSSSGSPPALARTRSPTVRRVHDDRRCAVDGRETRRPSSPPPGCGPMPEGAASAKCAPPGRPPEKLIFEIRDVQPGFQ